MTTNGDSSYTLPLTINGKDVTTETTFDVNSPSSQKDIWKCSSASQKDVTSAVESAHTAFSSWKRTNPAQRRDIFLKAADNMESRMEELTGYMAEETGGSPDWCGFNLVTSIEMIRDIAGRIAGAVEGIIPWPADPNTSAIVTKEPYGVVLAIAPWNAPYILGTRAIAYPLAAGNTVILKGSEFSPRVFSALASCFNNAGLPAGCLNVLFHRPADAAEITTALIAHKYIRKINFTGSTPVGSIIAQTAGKYIKPVLLELGGKAPAVVCADADLKKAALQCVLGAFFHAGQICMSSERIIVHESIKEEFSKELNAAVENVFGGQKADAPVMVSAAGREKTKKLVEQALQAGAKPLDGTKPDFSSISSTRMRPIILDNVTKDMDIYYTESFGPSVSLLTFSTEAEAIEIANDTEYGLAAAVFTENLATGLRIAKQIESGAVHINHMTVHDEPRLPHGGSKSSGFGRFGGNWGLDEFMTGKTITFSNA